MLFPFFIGWTVYGTYMFVMVSGQEEDSCTKNVESYSFLVFWFILSYTLIISYICVFAYACCESHKAEQMRRSII